MPLAGKAQRGEHTLRPTCDWCRLRNTRGASGNCVHALRVQGRQQVPGPPKEPEVVKLQKVVLNMEKISQGRKQVFGSCGLQLGLSFVLAGRCWVWYDPGCKLGHWRRSRWFKMSERKGHLFLRAKTALAVGMLLFWRNYRVTRLIIRKTNPSDIFTGGPWASMDDRTLV